MPEETVGPRTPRRVTLDDVARHAGVSRALVSIVMRDVPGAGAVTRERVLASARELGYRPDVRARSLAGQQSRLIGVMFGVAGRFHLDLLDGLYAAAETAGYGLVLSPVTPRRGEEEAVQSLEDFRFDALVMLDPPTPHPLMAGRLPLVVVGWHVDHPDVDSVRTSDEHGMHQVVEHLVGLGHRDIVHIDGGETPTGISRRDAFLAATRAAGLAPRVVTGGVSQRDGQRAVSGLLGEGRLPSAVVAYNDDVAVSVMNGLALRGVDIPGTMSVVGWDDGEIARLSEVDLTSVAQPTDQMAQHVVRRLVARLAGDGETGPRDVVLEPRLVARSSTAVPR